MILMGNNGPREEFGIKLGNTGEIIIRSEHRVS